MIIKVPEISWHETQPILGCDFQPGEHQIYRLATAGGEPIVRIWQVFDDKKSNECVRLLSELKSHKRPVNCVRWSVSGLYLASGSDDSSICLWKMNSDLNCKENKTGDSKMSKLNFLDDDEFSNQMQESWTCIKILKSHLEDVYDLAWSKTDDLHLVSGSVDRCIIVWRFPKPNSSNTDNSPSGKFSSLIIQDHKHYVQGVSWDPRDQYVCSLSSDRSMRVYKIGSRNCLYHVVRPKLPQTNKSQPNPHHASQTKLFQDDSWKSFFRRLEFSPDGEVLLCSAGCVPIKGPIPGNSSANIENSHGAHLFHRSQLQRPLVTYPTGSVPVVSVRFCPQPFKLLKERENNPLSTALLCRDFSGREPIFPDYRWIFCLALGDASLLLYDTENSYPISKFCGLHYQIVNDLTWSQDARFLVGASTDGYCSIVNFDSGELGEYYPKEKISSVVTKVPNPNVVAPSPINSLMELLSLNNKNSRTPKSLNKSLEVDLKINPLSPKQQSTHPDSNLNLEEESATPTKVESNNSSAAFANLKSNKRRVNLHTVDCILNEEKEAEIKLNSIDLNVSPIHNKNTTIINNSLSERSTVGSPSILKRNFSGRDLINSVNDFESKRRRVSFNQSTNEIRFYNPESIGFEPSIGLEHELE